jgi:hypothetical protein
VGNSVAIAEEESALQESGDKKNNSRDKDLLCSIMMFEHRFNWFGKEILLSVILMIVSWCPR